MNNSDNNQQYTRKNRYKKEYGNENNNINGNEHNVGRSFKNYNNYSERDEYDRNRMDEYTDNKCYAEVNDHINGNHDKDKQYYASNEQLYRSQNRKNNNYNKYNSYKNSISYNSSCNSSNYNNSNISNNSNYNNSSNNSQYYASNRNKNMDYNKAANNKGVQFSRNGSEYNKNNYAYANRWTDDNLSYSHNDNNYKTNNDYGNNNRHRANINKYRMSNRRPFQKYDKGYTKQDWNIKSEFNNRRCYVQDKSHENREYNSNSNASDHMYNNSNEHELNLTSEIINDAYEKHTEVDQVQTNDTSNLKQACSGLLAEVIHETDVSKLSTTDIKQNNTPVIMETQKKERIIQIKETVAGKKIIFEYKTGNKKQSALMPAEEMKEDKMKEEEVKEEVLNVADKFYRIRQKNMVVEQNAANKCMSTKKNKNHSQQNEESKKDFVLDCYLSIDNSPNHATRIKRFKHNSMDTKLGVNLQDSSTNCDTYIEENSKFTTDFCTDIIQTGIKIYESDLKSLVALRNEISEQINIFEMDKREKITNIAPFIVKSGIDSISHDNTISCCMKNDLFRTYMELTKPELVNDDDIKNYMTQHLTNSSVAAEKNEARLLQDDEEIHLEYNKIEGITIPVEEHWSEDDEVMFRELLKDGQKNFLKVSETLKKKIADVVLHYYRTKKKIYLPIKRKAGRISDENMKKIVAREWNAESISLFVKSYEVNGKDWGLYKAKFPNKTEGDFKLLYRYCTKYNTVKPMIKKEKINKNDDIMKLKYLSEFSIQQRQRFAMYYPFIGRNWSEMSQITNKSVNEIRGYYRYYFKKLSDEEQNFESNLQEIERDTNSCPSSPKNKHEDEYLDSCGVLFIKPTKDKHTDEIVDSRGGLVMNIKKI